MNKKKKPLILCIDDDIEMLKLLQLRLSKAGYRVALAENGTKGLYIAKKYKPNLVLLDVVMKQMDGYQVCAELQKNRETAYIPVIFVTAMKREDDRAKAIALGAVDFLVKPVTKQLLLEKTTAHIKTDLHWKKAVHTKTDLTQKTGEKSATWYEKIKYSRFTQFKEFLSSQLELSSEKKERLSRISYTDVYSISSELKIEPGRIAQFIAEYMNLLYLPHVDAQDVVLGSLPTPFCKSNHVVIVGKKAFPEPGIQPPGRSKAQEEKLKKARHTQISMGDASEKAFVISNPFDWELLGNLNKFIRFDKRTALFITEPRNIELLFKLETKDAKGVSITAARTAKSVKAGRKTASESMESKKFETQKNPVIYITNSILEKAVQERASDIHIEPKEEITLVRFRVDGDLKEYFKLKKKTGIQLLSRFKVLAGLDIAEKRKPQDGAFETIIHDRAFSLRLSTTNTPSGESLVIRLLEPNVKPKEMKDLGMTDLQAETMLSMVKRSGGMVLIVGAAGSGKTTTIYSLLHQIDTETRSLISVEDPVEYRIASANQQQVNEKAGVTFDALLKTAVRQDPDILFMGEIRDTFSAKIAIDFASTGHLTISTLHTTNATTAIFRLERLGIQRDIIGETVLAVIAQKLLKKLCSHCKKSVPISQEEIDMLAPFTRKIPSRVARPAGCDKCNNTGYYGRESVYEILKFDAAVSKMVQDNAPISKIRNYCQNKGHHLIANHAVEKVSTLTFDLKQIYERVLVEEMKSLEPDVQQAVTKKNKTPKGTDDHPLILLAEDDEDTRKLITRYLENAGCKITAAQDGIDALFQLNKKSFDLIISDINMPNMDGFKLMEIAKQKEIESPVIFLTGSTEEGNEEKGLELGALDYIKKPVKKEILLLRVKRVLGNIKS